MEKEFVQLLNRHAGIVYKVCIIYCDTATAREDLFQEIVLQLWKAWPSFRSDARFSTWMYRVALNTAITNYRRELRVPRRMPLEGLEIPDLSGTGKDEEAVRMLYKAIDQLNIIERAIILLYLDGSSYEEMSEITGITCNHVGVKLNRIKMKLETILKTLHYEHG